VPPNQLGAGLLFEDQKVKKVKKVAEDRQKRSISVEKPRLASAFQKPISTLAKVSEKPEVLQNQRGAGLKSRPASPQKP